MSVYSKENPYYLKLALDSIYESSLLPNQVVIVKDGCLTKELEDVLDHYTEVDYLLLDENKGLSCALNAGLSICKNELIARMDTDDICHSERFRKQINYLKQNPSVDIVGTYAVRIDADNKQCGILKVPITHTDISKYIWACPFIHPTVMFR